MFAASKTAAVSSAANYIEDVFSTYLYGTSATSIPNGIDISGKGALIWLKSRANDAGNMNNALFDSARGFSNILYSNTTGAQIGPSGVIASTSNNGFTLGGFNDGSSYASWTFRKQPKFFDVVTWSGNDTARTIAHNLGSVPGCIIVKSVTGSSVQNWRVYHRSLGATKVLSLNLTSAEAASTTIWNDTEPTSTEFSVGTSSSTNGSGQTYVAYLFAHDAGGFGLTGTDNVISCGSFTADASGNSPAITLGYEPQWMMFKPTSTTGNWTINDVMRGWSQTGLTFLYPNNTNADTELTGSYISPSATGTNASSGGFVPNATYIYIAIRRGPMKVPTSGTSVFDISTVSTSSGPVPGPTPTDMTLNKPSYNVSTNDWRANDRLRGSGLSLFPNRNGAETNENYVYFDYQNGLRLNSWPVASTIWYNFQRAPSFFDEVCYTGTSDSVGKTVNHNLNVAPELMIVKSRSTTNSWVVYVSSLGNTSGLLLNGTNAVLTGRSDFWDSTTPTSTVFSIGPTLNANTVTWVAYLFATCAGVSKVGSYTGTATTLQIDCGFTGGARFVLIKRTDSTGDWYVWDSARGIVAGNDPYLLLNSTAAEVTNTDYVDTYSAGFEITSTAPAAINASGGTFIFLAIA